ncbi:MAG: MCE family protein [Candidatus Omnitrophica bacterium]|nr:MCE family protein [Candidatus Omnitrophota bacterium]
MDGQTRRMELLVGLVVLIGITILIVIVSSISGRYIMKPGYHLKVTFSSANGVAIGAPVQFAGVVKGQVNDIKILYREPPNPPQVQLTVWLPTDVKVNADATVLISTFGLLGEKYLEIVPGAGTGRMLKNEDLLIGQEAVSMEELVQKTNKVLSALESGLGSINKFFGDEDTHLALRQTLQNSRELTATLQTMVAKVNSGEGTMGKLFMDEALYNEVHGFVSELRANPWKLLYRPPSAKKGQKSN